MKKNSTYFLFWLLIFVTGFTNAQVKKERARNSPTKAEHNRTIDSLLNVLKTLTSSSLELKPVIEGGTAGLRTDTTKLNTLNKLSREYINTSSYGQGLKYAQQAMLLGEKLIPLYEKGIGNNVLEKGTAFAYNHLGMVDWHLGNYDNGMNNYLKALKIFKKIDHHRGIAIGYNNIGLIHWEKGEYEKALENHLKALKIRETIKDSTGITNSLVNIGNIYMNQNKHQSAFQFYNMALKMNESSGSRYSEANILNNIGCVYLEWNDYKQAIDYQLKALKIKEEIGDKNGAASAYNNLGEIYYKQENNDSSVKVSEKGFKKALENYFKSLKINQEIGNIQGAANDYKSIGNIYLKQGKLNESYDYVTKALVIWKRTGYKLGIKEIYSILSELNEKKGDFKHALEYEKLFSDIKDSLLNEQSNKQIAEMDAKYDSEKKDKAIKLLNKEKENQASLTIAEERKQQVILFSVSGFSLMLMVFAMLIYRSFRQKQLLNKELEKLSIVASETDNGVLICGPKGELEWANAGLTRLLGYSLEEIKQRGTTLEEVSPNQEIKSLIRQSIENKKSAVYQVLNIAKDGTERWMQSTLTPILDEEGEIKKLVVIDTDVSERRKIEEKLSGQNIELEARTVEIEKQKKIVEKKNLKIIDSITYARLIQQSILMEESEIQHYLPDSFIYYQPKDIVSGDFYWFSKVDDILILAAIDCTGHGVPGAFMSMIGNTLMNQIVNEKRHTKPSEILRLLNLAIYEALHQQKGETLSHDGMDIALCSIDYNRQEIQYAGAQNPLYMISDNTIEVILADIHTIGGGGKIAKVIDPLERVYTNHVIPIKKGMSIYLFSDGFMDQFGDHGRKKFGIQQLKNLLLDIQHLDMQQQKEKMAAAFEDWKGITPQVDDVLVMGLKLDQCK